MDEKSIKIWFLHGKGRRVQYRQRKSRFKLWMPWKNCCLFKLQQWENGINKMNSWFLFFIRGKPLLPAHVPINIGDKLLVLYGPNNKESKVTYEAKVRHELTLTHSQTYIYNVIHKSCLNFVLFDIIYTLTSNFKLWTHYLLFSSYFLRFLTQRIEQVGAREA